MSDLTLLAQRLYSHHLNDPVFETPAEVVRWYGAVQAQEYLDTKWSLHQRMKGGTHEMIEQAFNEGLILRTHVMRPTWHFVAPEDLRWLLMLTGPRVQAINRHYNRQTELDEGLLAKGAETMAQALQGGNFLTRPELAKILAEKAGLVASGMRLSYLVMNAELEGVICSGPRRGKQFTYALLEERVPAAPTLTREEALAELVRRYFTSHGPATVQDFAWWSGLTVADGKAGLAMNEGVLLEEVMDGRSYWLAAATPADLPFPSPSAHLLATYDEYTVAYKDRSALRDLAYADKADKSTFWWAYLLDGRIVGMWRREFKKEGIVIESDLRPLSEAERAAIEAATVRYGEFYQMAVTTFESSGGKGNSNRGLKWD
jgi:hypothetical protein